jgi:hypothetical protein
MIPTNIGNQIGITYSTTVNGGRIAEDYNLAYLCPFQVKYAGLLLEFASAKTYDATGGEYLVVKPATANVVPAGWSFKTSARTDLLIGANIQFYPVTGDLTGGGNTYTEDETKFFPCTVCPMKNGELVGMPVYAGANLTLGAELACATGGFVRLATTGENVIGIAEIAANNSAGVSGAIFAKVRVIDTHTKA